MVLIILPFQYDISCNRFIGIKNTIVQNARIIINSKEYK